MNRRPINSTIRQCSLLESESSSTRKSSGRGIIRYVRARLCSSTCHEMNFHTAFATRFQSASRFSVRTLHARLRQLGHIPIRRHLLTWASGVTSRELLPEVLVTTPPCLRVTEHPLTTRFGFFRGAPN